MSHAKKPSGHNPGAEQKHFDGSKHIIAAGFLADLDEKIADGEIAKRTANTGGVRIVWKKALKRIAGQACWRKDRKDLTATDRHATIELAENLLTNEHRLMNTLAHEFCHLANMIISEVRKPPHGDSWKSWARRCEEEFGKSHGIEIKRTHNYEIKGHKYIWKCINDACAKQYKRFRKTIDPKKKRCGKCRGNLVQVQPSRR